MTAEQYARLSAPFRGERREKALKLVNKTLTGLCYAAYPALLLGLLLTRDGRLLRAVLVPGVSFVLLSLIRRGINAPRPYEVLPIAPIIHKDTRGKSMPSRHVFSMFVIAMTFLWICPVLGVVLLCFGAVLAGVRVVGGVHFPRDVMVGAAAGVLSGAAGYWLIP